MRRPFADLAGQTVLLFEEHRRPQLFDSLHHGRTPVHCGSQGTQAKQGRREHHENRGHVLLDRHETLESDDRLPAVSIEGMIGDFGQAGGLLIDQAVINVGGSNPARRTGICDQLLRFASREQSRKIAAGRNKRGGVGVDLTPEG